MKNAESDAAGTCHASSAAPRTTETSSIAAALASIGEPGLASATVRALSSALRALLDASADRAGDAPTDVVAEQHERIAVIAALEDLKSVASAVQARHAVAFDRAQRGSDADAGVPADRRGRGVAAQIGLARRESPHRGAVLLGFATAWVTEMPHTLAALSEGRLSEYRASLLASETSCLPVEQRAAVDAALCADPSTLDGVGTRRLLALVHGHAARLDPAAVVARHRRAAAERSVTLRAAPDAMTYLTALLPVAQGVACLAALGRDADTARSAGDTRSRGQLMADTLVCRLTGQAAAEAVPVTVDLVVSDATLLAAGHEPGQVVGYGPVPAQVARELVANGLDAGAAWLRRIYADDAGDLVATSTVSRFHPAGLSALLRVRDQGLCRMPFCDAPIRHLDHVVPAALGDPTDVENGQGLCEACNHAKQAAGWTQLPSGRRASPSGRPGGRHRVTTATPAGHVYASAAPPPPQPIRGARPASRSVVDRPAVARAVIDPTAVAWEVKLVDHAVDEPAVIAPDVAPVVDTSSALGPSLVDDAFAALVDGLLEPAPG